MNGQACNPVPELIARPDDFGGCRIVNIQLRTSASLVRKLTGVLGLRLTSRQCSVARKLPHVRQSDNAAFQFARIDKAAITHGGRGQEALAARAARVAVAGM